ncbi:MAG: 50S ribosomal protein L25 [Pirellulales bacterium]
MAEQFTVERREGRGKHHSKQMRAAGKLPAVLYGHGEDSVSLTLSADQVAAAMRHGSKLIELTGALTESALIHQLQWDPYGVDVLHMDLMRVRAGERISVEVAVVLRGESPGAKEGGVIDQVLHEVEIETDVASIPERLHININELQLEESLTAAEIEDLPEGAKLLTDAEQVVVQCNRPQEEAEEEAAEGAAEPELIGGREEEKEGE